MYFPALQQMFRSNISPPSSGLKRSLLHADFLFGLSRNLQTQFHDPFGTSFDLQLSICRYIPEDRTLHKKMRFEVLMDGAQEDQGVLLWSTIYIEALSFLEIMASNEE
jgi:hypothetical protein